MQAAHKKTELLKALAAVAAVAGMFIIVLHNITGLIG